jgi:Ca-activated chloride channel family protein
MTFANASAFLLFLGFIPLAVMKIIGDGMARRSLRRLARPRLLSRLRRGGWRGRDLIVFLLEALGLAFLIVAWARPQWGHTEREVTGSGRSIILALDTSRSMLANDLTPDRLTRARLAATDLIAALPGDRIGLIAFAGRAFLQAPLTTDHEALVETLADFDEDLIPRGGSNLSEPIELACETFDKAGTASHALIMFSDGDETEGRAAGAAKRAHDHNVMIVTVGVGTREGTLLPDANKRNSTGFMRDSQGRPVRSRLEDKVLETIARETGGLYLNLSSGSVLRERVEVILNKLDRSKTHAQKDRRQPIERYRWALVPGLLCLVAAFVAKIGRRMPSPRPGLAMQPAAAVATILLGIAGTPALDAATSANSSIQGTSPWALYHGQRYEEALERFNESLRNRKPSEKSARLEFGRGASAFRLNDYDEAVESFGRALASRKSDVQTEAEYNLANALAGRARAMPKGKGRIDRMIEALTQALRHYDAALGLDSAHSDARYNREAVQKYLDELKKYKEQLKQRQKGGGKKKQRQQNGGQGQQQQSADGQQGEEGEAGESGQEGSEGEEEGEGDQSESEGDEGDGEEGSNPGAGEQPQEDGKGGKGPDDQKQPGPEGDEKKRSGEQQSEGKLEARNGGAGGPDGDQRKQQSANSERKGERRHPLTGFSRTEARALLRALSDEDHVRPLTDKPVREGTYKNW